MNKGVVFVCGCARSGTSALTRLLNADPGFAIGMERYIGRVVEGRPVTPDLFETERFLNIEKDDTFYESFSFFRGYETFGERYRSARIVGDKVPRYYERLPELLENFPQAKIVFIVRNPYDVAASFKRRAENVKDQHWGRARSVSAAIAEWNASLRAALAQKHVGRLMVVSYEGLFAERNGLDALASFTDADHGRLEQGMQTLLKGREQTATLRTEILTDLEKRQIALTADFASYRLVVGGQPAPATAIAPRPERPAAVSRGPVAMKYADQDADIVDYQPYAIPGVSFGLRGPAPAAGARAKIVCLGSAATMGRFVERPYPTLLACALGVDVLNLGHGGARFETFLREPRLIEIARESDVVVLEAMSARSYGSRLFRPRSHLGGVGAIQEPYRSRFASWAAQRKVNPDAVFMDRAYEWAVRHLPNEELAAIAQDLMTRYEEDGNKLIEAVRRPVVLHWFSQAPMDRPLMPTTYPAWSGGFPHFVVRQVADRLAAASAALAVTVSSAGVPQHLRSRTTGEPANAFPWASAPAANTYYPSPQMHEAAAETVAAAIRGLNESSPAAAQASSS